ncbi:hypothetical protein Glove_87g51 [Diversispora epigaea]|uniref:Uncharacterized protein n=1 Tax=Diversispora epigaea TaxID=1348612 RepID=A0A397J6A4_9GLOM|nr:hypothetical protein Glove_87g51 [Diversispora epigaea]
MPTIQSFSSRLTSKVPLREEPKEPFPTIIFEEHSTEISSWIDRIVKQQLLIQQQIFHINLN